MEIRFDGQVVIVTGAGRGLNKETAKLFAARGARVLVNDYGGGFSTLEPGSIDLAQSVVDEIIADGGEAVADATSVGTGQAADAIVGKAVGAWGRVDVLVNACGGLLRGEFHEFTDEEVEGVLRSNFIGAYMLMRRCWPYFVRQRYGRVANTVSSAVLGIGRVTAYAAAKAALIGLSADAAEEGREANILVNSIAPKAQSRGTDRTTDDYARWMATYFKPEQIAPATVYLCSSANTSVTGEMFSVGGGRVARDAFFDSEGYFDRELTVEKLAENIDVARDMSNARLVTSALEHSARYASIAPWTAGEQKMF